MTITPEQRAHLEAHAAELAEHQADSRYPDAPATTVAEWIAGADEDQPYEAYYYMCLDLGLEPLEPHPT